MFRTLSAYFNSLYFFGRYWCLLWILDLWEKNPSWDWTQGLIRLFFKSTVCLQGQDQDPWDWISKNTKFIIHGNNNTLCSLHVTVALIYCYPQLNNELSKVFIIISQIIRLLHLILIYLCISFHQNNIFLPALFTDAFISSKHLFYLKSLEEFIHHRKSMNDKKNSTKFEDYLEPKTATINMVNTCGTINKSMSEFKLDRILPKSINIKLYLEGKENTIRGDKMSGNKLNNHSKGANCYENKFYQ